MALGVIKRIQANDGYGLIEVDDETADLIFYQTSVEGIPFGELREGQRVVFSAAQDPHNPVRMHAAHVCLDNYYHWHACCHCGRR